jgi:hypothetical protein
MSEISQVRSAEIGGEVMNVSHPMVAELAATYGLSADKLFEQAFASFLRDKRRQTLQTKLEILARYGVNSLAELEARLSKGEVPEHPAWEDLIAAENLETSLEEIDANLRRLQ